MQTVSVTLPYLSTSLAVPSGRIILFTAVTDVSGMDAVAFTNADELMSMFGKSCVGSPLRTDLWPVAITQHLRLEAVRSVIGPDALPMVH